MLRNFDHSKTKQNHAENAEISRILSAAVINSGFRKMLLSDPVKAVTGGYSGEKFSLRTDQKTRLSRIRAESLADFAAQLSEL